MFKDTLRRTGTPQYIVNSRAYKSPHEAAGENMPASCTISHEDISQPVQILQSQSFPHFDPKAEAH